MRYHLRVWFLVLMAAGFMNGCVRVYVCVRVTNNTAQKVFVRSTDTEKGGWVLPGRTREVEHHGGALVIKCIDRQEYRYLDISPRECDREYITGNGYTAFYLNLATNMELYLVKPGQRTVDPTVPQPEGFPKVGIRERQ
jgi:hypothetical protein